MKKYIIKINKKEGFIEHGVDNYKELSSRYQELKEKYSNDSEALSIEVFNTITKAAIWPKKEFEPAIKANNGYTIIFINSNGSQRKIDVDDFEKAKYFYDNMRDIYYRSGRSIKLIAKNNGKQILGNTLAGRLTAKCKGPDFNVVCSDLEKEWNSPIPTERVLKREHEKTIIEKTTEDTAAIIKNKIATKQISDDTTIAGTISPEMLKKLQEMSSQYKEPSAVSEAKEEESIAPKEIVSEASNYESQIDSAVELLTNSEEVKEYFMNLVLVGRVGLKSCLLKAEDENVSDEELASEIRKYSKMKKKGQKYLNIIEQIKDIKIDVPKDEIRSILHKVNYTNEQEKEDLTKQYNKVIKIDNILYCYNV